MCHKHTSNALPYIHQGLSLSLIHLCLVVPQLIAHVRKDRFDYEGEGVSSKQELKKSRISTAARLLVCRKCPHRCV